MKNPFKLVVGLLIAGLLWAAPRWVLSNDEGSLIIIRVDEMPSGSAVELWSGGDARRLPIEKLRELARESDLAGATSTCK